MVRRATPEDVPFLIRGILALARYEKREAECDLSEDRLHEHLFGADPKCFALVEEDPKRRGGEPIGFALCFFSYSTFRTRPCMHLEDLFVFPEHRGRGHGLRLLRAVAAEAVRLRCARLEWTVLDWNRPAIEFYERQGARLLPDWRICRLDGAALLDVASRGGA
ncbi:MAG: GNAT family N-acetyltransferase [Planctomycetota bacterium]